MQSELKPCAHETQCAKHTDTSHSGDLVEQLLDFDDNWHEATCKEAADHIETQAAEITRLTEALRAAEERADERYQQAIADVVEWLGERARICDDWEWEEDWIEADACRKAASQITRRFGKDA